MDLNSYVEHLGRELATLAETSGAETRELVERLSGALESAIRLTLLDTLSAAADEITRDLAPGSVELRLRAGVPSFVVVPPPSERAFRDGQDTDDTDDPADTTADFGATAPAPAEDLLTGGEDGATARVNFRLPEQLKAAIEEAASREGRSVNAWLVRVASAALQPREPARRAERRGKRSQQHYTGWVR